MDYCSLDDAFQEISGAPSPGCATDYSSKAARKEERRRARKCKTPAAANYLHLNQDPDRQHLNPLPEVEAMNPIQVSKDEGFFHHGNQWLHSNEKSSTVKDKSSPEFDHDPLQKYVADEERGHLMVVPVNGDHHLTSKHRFFGASGPDEEFFADYQPDKEDYRLQPDFTKAFDLRGLDRAGSGPATTLPPPNANVAWKPLSKGVPSSFYDKLSIPKGSYVRTRDRDESHNTAEGDMSNQEIMRRMDVLFARLDDLHQTTPERMTSEMLMFISTGIFVMFMMDVLVKKGSQLRF
jgi:hypothetical protein